MFSKSDSKSYQYVIPLASSRCSSDKIAVAADSAAVDHNSRKIFQFSRKQYYFLFTHTLLITIGIVIWHDACFQAALAAPQSSCVLCDNADIEAKDPRTNVEEYKFEHQVTRQDAINTLKTMNETFYGDHENSCKSLMCTKIIMKYCMGPQFINDHCLCELGHNEEGIPFVPHICYVGKKVPTASVGSCFFYEEVKDCCCVRALAKQWRHISGSQSSHKSQYFLISAAALLVSFLVIK